MLCAFNKDGECVKCGHRTAIAGLIRVCNEDPHEIKNVIARQHDEGSKDNMPALSFLEKVKNFASAAAGHVAAGMPMCSDEEITRRHDICLGCEHLQNDACNLCGCAVSRVAGYVSKLSWADQECPIGKWGKATGD